MAFKQEERLSANALEKYLIDTGFTFVSWKPGPDPPDLEFTLVCPNGVQEIWGIEVTSMTQYIEQYVGEKGKEVERRVFEPAVHRLCEQLNDQFRSVLKNGYALSVTGPLDAKVFRTLRSRIEAYIKSGRTERTALDMDEVIASVLNDMSAGGASVDMSEPEVQWVLDQLAPSRERVSIVGFPGEAGIWVATGVSGVDKLPSGGGVVADVQASVDYSVDRILREKLPILRERVTGYTRKLLLIWSDLPLAKPVEVIQSLDSHQLTIDDLDALILVDFGWRSVHVLRDFASLWAS